MPEEIKVNEAVFEEEKPEAEKPEAEKPEAEKPEAEKPEAEPIINMTPEEIEAQLKLMKLHQVFFFKSIEGGFVVVKVLGGWIYCVNGGGVFVKEG